MSFPRTALRAWSAVTSLGLLSLVVGNACSSGGDTNTTSTAGSPGSAGTQSNQAGGSVGAGGNTGIAGNTVIPGTSGNAGTVSTAGQGGVGTGGTTPGASGNVGTAGSTAGANTGGGGANTAGANTGGSGGAGNTAGANTGGTGGVDPLDDPPPHKLNVTASPMEHQHGNAGMDARAKPLGKLVVDIGVSSGSYVAWLAKRGYHSMGAPCGGCPAPNLDGSRDTVGTCREGEFANTAAAVKSTLTNLAGQYPEEDWGYFLNAKGEVRWSDVAITGMSHGATTAAVAGRVVARMWRVVSRSGPRDTTCGAAGGVCTLPLSTPSYDPACPAKKIASWLDTPSKTPMDRFYGLVGITDVECGDIMFDMQYAKYPGVPTIWDTPGAVLTGVNQFFSTKGGHLDFLRAATSEWPMNTEAVLNIAFGIPPENQNPAF